MTLNRIYLVCTDPLDDFVSVGATKINQTDAKQNPERHIKIAGETHISQLILDQCHLCRRYLAVLKRES